MDAVKNKLAKMAARVEEIHPRLDAAENFLLSQEALKTGCDPREITIEDKPTQEWMRSAKVAF